MGRPRREDVDDYPRSSSGQRGPDGEKLNMTYPRCLYCKGKLSSDDFVMVGSSWAHGTCHDDKR